MKKLLVTLILLAVLGGIGYWGYTFFSPHVISTGAGEQGYTNDAYRFSLTMPAGFTASEIPDPDTGGETVVLQNKSGDGIQIVISPFDEDMGGGYTLTKERILQDLPDMNITNEQPVEVGNNYKGLAFISDDPNFGTSSRAVWFVYQGNLYQINTYSRLDALLQSIFATWQFQ